MADRAGKDMTELALVQAATFGQSEIVQYMLGGSQIPKKVAEKTLLAACSGKMLPALRQELVAKEQDLTKLASKQKSVKMKLDRSNIADTQKKLKSQLYELGSIFTASQGVHNECANRVNDMTAAYCNIIMQAFEKGARNQTEGLVTAASNGHSTLVQFLLEAGVRNVEKGLLAAARCGDIPTVQIILATSPADLNPSLCAAAELGHIEVMKLLVQGGANDFNRALLTAEHHAQRDAVSWLQKGADGSQTGYSDPGYSWMLEKERTHELKQERLRQRKAAHQTKRDQGAAAKEQEQKVADLTKHQKLINDRKCLDRVEHRAQLCKQQQLKHKAFLLASTAKHINIVREEDLDRQQRERKQRASKAAFASRTATTTNTLSSLEAVLAKNRAMKPVKSTGDIWTLSISRRENKDYCAAPESYYVSKYHKLHREQILKTRTVVDYTDGILMDRSQRAFVLAQEYALRKSMQSANSDSTI